MSTRSRSYHIDARFVITAESLELLRKHSSPSGKFVWVSTREKLRVCTLKGVPGKHVDLLLPDITQTEGITVCEIGRKVGSFDDKVRWRLCIRSWPTQCFDDGIPSLRHPGPGKILIDEEVGQTAVICLWKNGEMWAQSFPRLEYTVEKEALAKICMYHYEHYYNFLPAQDAMQTAEMWANLPHTQACEDIVVLNRTASAALYDLARQLGWRKLTLREKGKLGLDPDGPQWQKQEWIAKRQKNNSGAGEYTISAANGDLEYIKTAHGTVDLE